MLEKDQNLVFLGRCLSGVERQFFIYWLDMEIKSALIDD